MSHGSAYRRFFLMAGIVHLLAGIAALIVMPAYFRPLGIPTQTAPFFWQLTSTTTACFGLAGIWIAQDPRRNRDLIQVWLLVKAAAAVLALWNIRTQGLRPPVGILVAVDAAWVVAFTSILARLGRTPTDS